MPKIIHPYKRREKDHKFNRLIDAYEALEEKDQLAIDMYVTALHCGYKENCSSSKHTHPFSIYSALEIIGELIIHNHL